MFSKLSLLASSLLVVSCQAQGIYPLPPSGTANLCCATVGSSSNTIIQNVAATVGVDLSAIPVCGCGPSLIGVTCVPITVAAPTCSNTAVNCNVNPLGNGQINFGCVPIP
ncbi:hypothetical protein GGX14DRAFT_568220 [Mycena pura]|uniref:Hydrophobin n=1 Tax=Mycena pura TaxID=153505 RepID=A0AAD6YAR9_9AGAR|nr:hypothetical protein GGX14DRAFT_568220 [Mycena pura]